jgi:large subunit ribosomal protein L10
MRAEKNYLIKEVETHLKKSDYVILTNFSKVTVADAAELRKRLDVEKAEFHVVKNSSLRVAAKTLGLPEFECALIGPTAVIVGGKNSAGVAKVLKKFFEDKQKLDVKIGVIDKKLISASELAKIADLPSCQTAELPNPKATPRQPESGPEAALQCPYSVPTAVMRQS